MFGREPWLPSLIDISDALAAAAQEWSVYEDRYKSLSIWASDHPGQERPDDGEDAALAKAVRAIDSRHDWARQYDLKGTSGRMQVAAMGSMLQVKGLEFEINVWQHQIYPTGFIRPSSSQAEYELYMAAVGKYNGLGLGAAASGWRSVQTVKAGANFPPLSPQVREISESIAFIDQLTAELDRAFPEIAAE